MSHYTQGKTTRQGHKGIPEGLFEEEQGLKGFFGPVSHLLKSKPSTRWTSIEGPLRPHMYDLIKIGQNEQRLLFNSDLTLTWKFEPKNQPLYGRRNADGDLLYFCHKGRGEFLTEYGLLSFRAGEYTVMPKCITHTLAPSEDSAFLVIENRSSHFEQPNRGLVGRHALYDENTLAKPNLDLMHERLNNLEDGIFEIRVKRNDQYTSFKYTDTIYDTVGWKGDLYPYGLHMDNIMPLMSHRAHLPPSAHTTFVAREFIVCSFLPRPLEKDADALKVPFYHQNIDYDEVIFYHDGDFFSRDNLHAGMMSFHPAGFPHGPHPKAFKNIGNKTETNEYAVMIDSRQNLVADPGLQQFELMSYWQSWKAHDAP